MRSNKCIIAPSILSANFARLAEEVNAVLSAGADWIHIDVMDNHYVPNLTFGPLVCSALRAEDIEAFFDVHLMVEPVDALIPEFAKAGANSISFHPEATKHPHRTVQLIKSHHCKVGIALNPATPISLLDYLWDDIDMILLMSVNPGFGGQSFISSALEKISTLRREIDRRGHNIRLQVDGGVNTKTITAIAAAGADTFVAGSAIFKSSNYSDIIAQLRQAL